MNQGGLGEKMRLFGLEVVAGSVQQASGPRGIRGRVALFIRQPLF